MSENVLKVEHVTMQFGGVVAVDNLNLEGGGRSWKSIRRVKCAGSIWEKMKESMIM